MTGMSMIIHTTKAILTDGVSPFTTDQVVHSVGLYVVSMTQLFLKISKHKQFPKLKDTGFTDIREVEISYWYLYLYL